MAQATPVPRQNGPKTAVRGILDKDTDAVSEILTVTNRNGPDGI